MPLDGRKSPFTLLDPIYTILSVLFLVRHDTRGPIFTIKMQDKTKNLLNDCQC